MARFRNVADFLIAPDGHQVACEPRLDDVEQWLPLFRQQIVPLARHLQGDDVFHGGAVAYRDRAIVLLGPSGLGKSTLTAALARRGCAFLGDDCLIVRRHALEAMVHPDIDHVRLWPDSAAALACNAMSNRTIKGKTWVCASETLPHRHAPLPLDVAFVLTDDYPNREVSALSPADATMAWSANTFVLDLKAPDSHRRRLAVAAELANRAPVFLLRYPRDFSQLGAVADLVLETCEAVGAKG